MRTRWKYAWHVHHMRLFERLEYSLDTRRKFIETGKPANEIEIRLRLLKLVRNQGAIKRILAKYERDRYKLTGINAYDKMIVAITALHKQECKDCPWNGYTIFPIKKVVIIKKVVLR